MAPPLIPLPSPRGAITEHLLDRWRTGRPVEQVELPSASPLADDDLQLALWCCYHLHVDGFADVDDREWDPGTLALRADLERRFEEALRAECGAGDLPADPVAAIRVIAGRAAPPLASWTARHASWEQLVEFVVHRSLYQLKEADAHTFGIPRLRGPGRASYLQLQLDEYGGGAPGEAHAELFAAAMRDLGLDDRLGAHLEAVPATTLATDNLVTMLGLHRRLRAALVGHLALFEACSVAPMSSYAAACTRLGAPPSLRRFYEVHVEADVEHGRLALEEMTTGFAGRDDGGEGWWAREITFGAAALQRVEARFASHLLQRWEAGQTSLRHELPVRPPQPTPSCA